MGHAWSLIKQQLFSYKTTFSADQIPDLTGQVIIVTGGNAGLGKETIKSLLLRNAKVYLAARSKPRADEAIQELRELTGKEAIFLELDLASLDSVRKAAKTFLSLEPELHVLFNNAGLMTPPMDKFTADGYDLQYGTNVLGHLMFTELLLPVLTAGAKSSPDKHSRIVATSSAGAHMFAVDFDTFKDGPARKKMDPQKLYFQSKFLNGVVAREVAQRYAHRSILSFSCDPGSVRTELLRDRPAHVRFLTNLLFVSPAKGALSQLWAGTMPEAIQYNGQYIIPWAHVGRCREEMYDPVLGERVWNTLVEQSKEH